MKQFVKQAKLTQLFELMLHLYYEFQLVLVLRSAESLDPPKEKITVFRS